MGKGAPRICMMGVQVLIGAYRSIQHGGLIYQRFHLIPILLFVMSTPTADAVLATARYGKDKVRVFRVKRESNGVHFVVEYNVTLLVEGDIETSCVFVRWSPSRRWRWPPPSLMTTNC